MLEGPVIKYITIGGVFDFYFFFGPTPENVVQQYTEVCNYNKNNDSVIKYINGLRK